MIVGDRLIINREARSFPVHHQSAGIIEIKLVIQAEIDIAATIIDIEVFLKTCNILPCFFAQRKEAGSIFPLIPDQL